MKFPKEKALTLNLVTEYFDNCDYLSIYKMKNQILENYKNILDTDVIETLIYATFAIGNFDDVIIIGDELMRKGYESYTVLSYMLASTIANCDIYQGMSYIKRSKLLNEESAKIYYLDDGANYTNIMGLDYYEKGDFLTSMLLVNFIKAVSKETSHGITVDKDYLLFRFFDMMNMIYELGYEEEFIEKMIDIMKTVFMLEI